MDEIAESNFLFAMVGVIFIFTFLLVVSVAGVTFSLQAFFDRVPPKGGLNRRSKKAAHSAAGVNTQIVTFS